jgi:hypothetical protein
LLIQPTMKLSFAHAYLMSWTPFQHQPINFYSPKILSNSSSKNIQYSIVTTLASQNTQHMRETSCHSPSSQLWLLSNLMYYLLPLHLRSNIYAKILWAMSSSRATQKDKKDCKMITISPTILT